MAALVGEEIHNRQGSRDSGCADEPVSPGLVETPGVRHCEGCHGKTEHHEEERDETHGDDVARVVGRLARRIRRGSWGGHGRARVWLADCTLMT